MADRTGKHITVTVREIAGDVLWGPATVRETCVVADLIDKVSKPVGCSGVTLIHHGIVLDSQAELSKLAPPLELTAHFEPPKRYVACRLASIDTSGDTAAETRSWDILLPCDDERLALLATWDLKNFVLPRCYNWEHTDDPSPDHLYNARPNWTSKQMALYQAFGEILEDIMMLNGSLLLHEMAGRGPFEVLPGILTVSTEFGLGFCQHHQDGRAKCSWGFGRASWPICGRPTCHCDLGQLIATADEGKLDAMLKDLKDAGRSVFVSKRSRRN
eukprot:TRINITY_DN2216_c0_g1_i1.p1 TRINITY_DN2216_c0_g1~~TRINITY_DN2216_c0_g1_i1.p1  ORF type:complete len:291 (+),score=30.93 TRINITY_DN2216_c0_g1_i1:56-874(+)